MEVDPFAAKKSKKNSNPFELRKEPVKTDESRVHVIREGVCCNTEQRGFARPSGRSPLEIVVDASDGFIPLWAHETTLHYRFRDSSFEHFDQPLAAKAALLELFGEAILLWGDARPVEFKQDEGLWDFEIVMQRNDDCDSNGCVLASAFFPDGGRHQLDVYPKMLEQSRTEQVETMAHEIGHIFGLRHFFAKVDEAAWPAEIFGEHQKFSIMNYGSNSVMSEADRTDLKRLYEAVWAEELTKINGTPIRIVRPYHTIKLLPDAFDQMLPRAAARRRVMRLPR